MKAGYKVESHSFVTDIFTVKIIAVYNYHSTNEVLNLTRSVDGNFKDSNCVGFWKMKYKNAFTRTDKFINNLHLQKEFKKSKI